MLVDTFFNFKIFMLVDTPTHAWFYKWSKNISTRFKHFCQSFQTFAFFENIVKCSNPDDAQNVQKRLNIHFKILSVLFAQSSR